MTPVVRKMAPSRTVMGSLALSISFHPQKGYLVPGAKSPMLRNYSWHQTFERRVTPIVKKVVPSRPGIGFLALLSPNKHLYIHIYIQYIGSRSQVANS